MTTARPLAPRLPSLTALRTFEAVGRLSSLTAAAAELGVTVGAVSRQLKALNSELPGPLMRRRGNRLELTPEGRRFHAATRAGFLHIEEAGRNWSLKQSDRPLIVAALATFTLIWLIPRLPRWREQNPEIELQVVPLRDEGIDLNEEGVDAMIDVGRWPRNRSLIRKVFMRDRSGPVMAPSYALAHGPWSTPQDLARATWLINRHRDRMLEDWFEANGLAPPKPARTMIFDHLHMALAAAEAGLGVVIGTECYVDGRLRDGRLVAPFGLANRSIPFFLAWPRQQRRDQRLARFAAWLEREGAAVR